MKDRAVIGKYGNLFGQIGCRQAKCLCHSSHEFWGSEEPWAAARSLCPWHGWRCPAAQLNRPQGRRFRSGQTSQGGSWIHTPLISTPKRVGTCSPGQSLSALTVLACFFCCSLLWSILLSPLIFNKLLRKQFFAST